MGSTGFGSNPWMRGGSTDVSLHIRSMDPAVALQRSRTVAHPIDRSRTDVVAEIFVQISERHTRTRTGELVVVANDIVVGRERLRWIIRKNRHN